MADNILLKEEREVLKKQVARLVFLSHGDLFAILKDHALEIKMVQPPIAYAENIIVYCERSAWVENPALIIKLLSNWEILPEISSAITRLTNAPPPRFHEGDKPWEACHVALDLPFLNRMKTREMVPLFLEDYDGSGQVESKRVMIVNGPAGIGKTYTHKYLQYLNAIYTTAAFELAYIDYKTYVTSRFGAVELLESILSVINPSWKATATLPVFDNEQPARWRLQLAKFLGIQIASTKKKWFIVLDRFNDSSVPAETIEFIQLLADVATGSKFPAESNDLIRLVLLGFNHTIENYEKRVTVEDIEQLNRDDIASYFRRYIALKGINIEINNIEIINFLVDKVLEKDPGNVPDRTRLLAQRALKIATELETPTKN
jgi:hypothetical protein